MSDGIQVSQDEKEIHMKHGDSGGPEPLTFTHNGEPATINLERFKQQPQAEPLTFTHTPSNPAVMWVAVSLMTRKRSASQKSSRR